MRLTISDIASHLGAEFDGDGALEITGVREPSAAGPSHLALAMDARFGPDLNRGKARAAILWAGADWRSLGLKAGIFVPRARYAMAGVTSLFDTGRQNGAGIHATAIIDPTAEVPADAMIGPFVLIGPNVKIGKGAIIHAHCTIADATTIGSGARLLEGVRIGHGVTIGCNFICHANAVIGSDGFSFVTPEPGAIDAMKSDMSAPDGRDAQEFARIHSLGGVVIGDNVEIGAGSTIDRGTVSSTTIGPGTKIDNLVHVAHNVVIGATCLLCGQVGVAGSAVIGDRVVLGGQVGVADHVTIGSNVIAAGKSGISSNVPPNRAVMGNPAIRMDANIESYKQYRRLPRIVAKLNALQKSVSKSDPKG